MKCNRVLLISLILIFLIILIICSYLIIKSSLEYKENEQITEELIEDVVEVNSETKEITIDWNNLKSINEDIIGWIEIENTKINYPILKDSGNLFYLRHTYNKQYSSSGSIFTTNENSFVDNETIIYGHNMKNGSMFSSLGKYLDEEYLYSHQNFKIYTQNGNYVATIFSIYSIGFDIESNNIKQLEFDERIEYYKNTSKINIENVDVSTKIVKLSTCSYINAKTVPTDQRYYIIATLSPLNK